MEFNETQLFPILQLLPEYVVYDGIDNIVEFVFFQELVSSAYYVIECEVSNEMGGCNISGASGVGAPLMVV